MNPLVTVMIPTYNQAPYLPDAIQSALNQDYSNLEIVVVDDCSTDETSDTVKKFLSDGRLRYYKNATNLGKTANYRHALYDIARGDWVLNLDGDDYLTDDHYLSFAMKEISRHDRVVLFTAGVKHRGDGFSKNQRLVRRQLLMDGEKLFFNWHQYKIPHLTSLYHRPTACRIGFYDVDISSADWESLLRLVWQGNVILSDRIAGVWRKHDENLSRAMDYSQFAANFALIARPSEYAAGRGRNKGLLEAWEKTMINAIMKGQFNEVWRGVLRKHSWPEMLRFISAVRNDHPEFLGTCFQPKNTIHFFLFLSATALNTVRRGLERTAAYVKKSLQGFLGRCMPGRKESRMPGSAKVK